MPCNSCSYPPDPPRGMARTPVKAKAKSPTKQERELRKQLDEVTNFLCGACKYLEKMQASISLKSDIVYNIEKGNNELVGFSDWWEKHKAIDKKKEDAKHAKPSKFNT